MSGFVDTLFTPVTVSPAEIAIIAILALISGSIILFVISCRREARIRGWIDYAALAFFKSNAIGAEWRVAAKKRERKPTFKLPSMKAR